MVEEKLKELFMETFQIEITEENKDHTLRMLGLNSMDFVTLIVAIEERMNYDLYSLDVDLSQMRTFNKVLNVINEHYN